MSDSQSQQPGSDARAGSRSLNLLADALNVDALRALEQGSAMSLTDVHRATGMPAKTTLRGHLRDLAKLGLLERRPRVRATDHAYVELTTAGFEFLEDAEVVSSWLAKCPEESMELGTPMAKNALKALAGGWSETLVHAFATRPHSLTELAGAVDLNYPSIERRMAAMRSIGLLAPAPGDGRVRPYEPSDWLRRAVGPLTAAARWEQVNSLPGAQPFSQIDMEAALSLIAPLLRLPRSTSGSCRIEIEASESASRSSTAAIVIEAKRGQMVHSAAAPDEETDASSAGTADEWFWALVENDPDQLVMDGNKGLARATLAGMHQLLFG